MRDAGIHNLGFLNLPSRNAELRDMLVEFGYSELLSLPVLGSEFFEKPWSAMDKDEFFSVVKTGFHFADGIQPVDYSENVITCDPATAFARLKAGLGCRTGICGAIGGTFPIIGILENKTYSARIGRVLVLADGASGFVASEMERRIITAEEALNEAQWKGYAPSNPSRHIHGLVSCERLALLAYVLTGTMFDPSKIETRSFVTVDKTDVVIGKKLGLSIRPLGLIKFPAADASKKDYELWVGPCLIPDRFLLAQVRGGAEMTYIQCEDGENLVFSGPGSSARTALAGMLRDMEDFKFGRYVEIPSSFCEQPESSQISEPIGRYYLRFSLVDFAEALSGITSIFSESGIEIENIYHPETGYHFHGSSESGKEIVLFTTPIGSSVLAAALDRVKTYVKLATLMNCLRFEK